MLPGGIAMWSEPVFTLETEELPDCEIVAHSELSLACMTEVEAEVA